jgi:23S rRNA pseudouridine1911/1915/1917 synthase
MKDEVKTFVVDGVFSGVRLDKFLAAQMPEYSRSEIQKFEITPATKMSEKVKVGQEYSVRPSSIVRRPSSIGEAMDLDIVFEDDDIIVINKPRGIVMYPAAGNPAGTLVNGVLGHTHLSSLGGDVRPGVVHRIDKDTSGLVVLAKSDAAFRALVKIFSQHDLVRKYIAFVWGVPNWTAADITGNIARSSRNRQKMTMVNRGGKEAATHAEVINAWTRDGVSELRCTLDTGRTHQIRVHLSAHGFPVLCDPLYGRGNARLGSVKNPELLEFIKTHHGQMLHAEVLEFRHPTTGEQLKFRAKLPDDMQELKEILD